LLSVKSPAGVYLFVEIFSGILIIINLEDKRMLAIVVGLFAIIGALLRDGIGIVTAHLWHGIFPFATLSVNWIGCFVLGWFNYHIKKLDRVSVYIKTGFGTGLVGSFTTFSTFSVDTIKLFETGHITLGLIYLLDSFVGGFLLAYLGMRLGMVMMNKSGGAVR
ncbi:MAG TPA: CrcB family protein, partial [Sporolactobacillaceae bacterium]|nr:CrcB family protein [Sporolactobacillaceae bacterium]